MAENTKIIISAVDKTKKGFGSVGRALGGLTKSLFSMRTALVGVAGVAGFAPANTICRELLYRSSKKRQHSTTSLICAPDRWATEQQTPHRGLRASVIQRGMTGN